MYILVVKRMIESCHHSILLFTSKVCTDHRKSLLGNSSRGSSSSTAVILVKDK
uniref:Uncharacterized protein n=1 Tax=Anguilla anguilla TaxID=7936 RepID=A0A0E9RM83_ANGAN